MDFEKGLEPRKALKIGKNRPIEKGETFYVWCHAFGKEIEVEAIGNEFAGGSWETNKHSKWIKARAIQVRFKKGGYTAMAFFREGWEADI